MDEPNEFERIRQRLGMLQELRGLFSEDAYAAATLKGWYAEDVNLLLAFLERWLTGNPDAEEFLAVIARLCTITPARYLGLLADGLRARAADPASVMVSLQHLATSAPGTVVLYLQADGKYLALDAPGAIFDNPDVALHHAARSVARFFLEAGRSGPVYFPAPEPITIYGIAIEEVILGDTARAVLAEQDGLERISRWMAEAVEVSCTLQQDAKMLTPPARRFFVDQIPKLDRAPAGTYSGRWFDTYSDHEVVMLWLDSVEGFIRSRPPGGAGA